MNRLPILLLATSLALAACAVPAQGGGLKGRTFLSKGVSDGGIVRPLAPDTQVRLVFNADGSLGASAGCNIIGGTYRVDGGVLRVEAGGMTEMGCDPARHAQDDWLVAFLASAPQVSLTGNDLTLVSGATAISLLDRDVAEPDLPLAGTLWTVDSIIDGETVSSIPDGARATLRIAEDGSAVFNTGCNEGGATVTMEGDRLRFVDAVTTDRACLDAGGGLERAVLAVLGADSVTWSIEARRLTLQAGPNGLSLQGG
jgi:heat shock protein HslJ